MTKTSALGPSRKSAKWARMFSKRGFSVPSTLLPHSKRANTPITHIAQTVATAPDDQWIFITDQLNTHQSESLVRWVAKAIGETCELGEKGKSGILKSMSSRAEFLAGVEHRIRFVYTPKHCSWLNQIEMWFSILVRRLLKRASFKSTDELRQRILEFIEYFNRTLAKPFKWPYKGRPLTV